MMEEDEMQTVTFGIEADVDESHDRRMPDDPMRGSVYETREFAVRICTPKEEGYPVRGPLAWLNSAAIVVNPDEDALHMRVSVGDPRGAWVFTVRRLGNGMLEITTPHDDESMPHVRVREFNPRKFGGTYRTDAVFADEPPEDEDADEG